MTVDHFGPRATNLTRADRSQKPANFWANAPTREYRATTMQQRLIAHLLLVAVAVAAGCGASTSPRAVPRSAHSAPPRAPAQATPATSSSVPLDLRDAVERALVLGRLLYVYDHVASIATDVLLAHIASPSGVGGYLALTDSAQTNALEGPFSVLFFTPGEDPQIAYRLRAPNLNTTPTFEKLDPPQTPNDEQRLLIKARHTAIRAQREVLQPMNPIVLPRALTGAAGILVYLIAGTQRPDVAVLGKHYRVLVSADGRDVVSFEPLSKTVIELPLPEANGPSSATPAGVVVTHVLGPAPIETHVFASLLYRVPVYVGTSRGDWKVDGESVELLRPRPPAAP